MRTGTRKRLRPSWASLVALLAVLAPARAHAERERVVVQEGDILSRIAASHHVTVRQLQEWNGLGTDVIWVGQKLWLAPESNEPAAPPPPAPPPPPPEPALPEGPRSTYTVLRGDNLNRIATRLGVPVDLLVRANPTMRRDRLRPGQTLLVIGATRLVEHVVRRGETMARLADRYEVSVRDLFAWNPSVRPRGLQADMTLRIYTDVRISRSMSVGSVNAGRLEHAEPLPPHRGYVIRDAARAFGTAETVQWLLEAFAALHERDPDAPPVRVHDLSRAEGGHLADHRSHQSGRDADVAYYRTDCRRGPCAFRTTTAETLDAERQWALFAYWLRAGVVDMIFVDRALHAPLYEAARRAGATAEELSRWFQYPRAGGNPYGVIRHFPNHANHFHVRFVCPEGDDLCEARPLLARDDD